MRVALIVLVAIAFAITRGLTSYLYNVRAFDPLTFAGVAAFFAAVTAASCYLPARRGATVAPMEALRHD